MIFGRESFIQNLQVLKEKLSRIALIVVCRLFSANVSVNSKPDHLSRATPGDSHILVAPEVGFASLSCPGVCTGFFQGVSNQSKSSIILKKARFLFCFLNN